VDDIFLIIKVSTTPELTFQYIKETFVHKYLTFSFIQGLPSVDFLDLTITLSDTNEIQTEIYQKKVSKHQFILFDSHHPKHLLKSLPYSQGIRIIRNCSDPEARNRHIQILLNKFRTRGYPEEVLEKEKNNLSQLNRFTILKPKSTYLIDILRLHNPEILSLYKINPNSNLTSKTDTDTINLIVPFYKQLKNLDLILLSNMEELVFQTDNLLHIHSFQHVILNRRNAYTITNNLKQPLTQK